VNELARHTSCTCTPPATAAIELSTFTYLSLSTPSCVILRSYLHSPYKPQIGWLRWQAYSSSSSSSSAADLNEKDPSSHSPKNKAAQIEWSRSSLPTLPKRQQKRCRLVFFFPKSRQFTALPVPLIFFKKFYAHWFADNQTGRKRRIRKRKKYALQPCSGMTWLKIKRYPMASPLIFIFLKFSMRGDKSWKKY
jgi:hypothetical protein